MDYLLHKYIKRIVIGGSVCILSLTSGCGNIPFMGYSAKQVATKPKSSLDYSSSTSRAGMRQSPLLLSQAPTPLKLPDNKRAAAAQQDGESSSIPLPNKAPPPGFFMPRQRNGSVLQVTAPKVSSGADSVRAVPASTQAYKGRPERIASTDGGPLALVYVSKTTQAYFAAGGLDYNELVIDPWIRALHRIGISTHRTGDEEDLLRAKVDLLVLPSAVALSTSEREKLERFRRHGGSMIATWLAGVWNDRGQWAGYGFMRDQLDTDVVGSTQDHQDDTFLIAHGDSPVSHQLPAGGRIWVERLADWYPLRLQGAHSALSVMDWARTVPGHSSSVLSFGERSQPVPSRVAVLGIPERLWLSMDNQALDTLLSDALYWLARRPDAYLATWPGARASAMMLSMDITDAVTPEDFATFRLAEELGGKASLFFLSERLSKLDEQLTKRLQGENTPIGFLGDQYEGFKDEPARKQLSRLKGMVSAAKRAGFPLGDEGGFHAPMESFDETTNGVLAELGFVYHVTDPSVSENLLPTTFMTEQGKDILLLPRSMLTAEQTMDTGLNKEGALALFAHAIKTHVDMGGVTVVPFQQQSPFARKDFQDALTPLFRRPVKPWVANGQEISRFWRERSRVSMWLDTSVSPAILHLAISGDKPLQQAVNVVVNIAKPQAGYQLIQDEDDEQTFLPRLEAVDEWRMKFSLEGAAPGKYHWYVVPTTGESIRAGNSSRHEQRNTMPLREKPGL